MKFKNLTQKNFILKILEQFVKTNPFLYKFAMILNSHILRNFFPESDFTGLKFPDGYTLVDPANYTEQLIAKVDAAEASGSGQYIEDDGKIYESAEVVIMSTYGATYVDPFEPGKDTCQKHSGRWYVITAAVKAVSGGSLRADITNAKSKEICEAANGEWVCKQGRAGSTGGLKAVESYGKFTNKKNVNTKSKLPTLKAFDTDKLPSLDFATIK